MNIYPADRIRKAFREFVATNQSGASDSDEIMLETTLVRDGMYCGRRFALDGFNLVYFAEEQQIKLYGPEGGIERRCSLLDFYRDFLRDDQDARRAA